MPVASPRRVALALLFATALSLAGSSVQPVFGGSGPGANGATATDTDGDGLTDAFESNHHCPGLNKSKADSDGDGLLDPAEDSDGDGLSNLAEQTFGTNPCNRNSDGDNKLDGEDDANHDGIADWIEQDARPLPDHLTPSLADANNDGVCYEEGVGSTGKCIGDPNGTINIAIYGDSHAGQWIPALDKYALTHGWRLRDIAKSGCPSIHISTTTNADFNAECRKWRSDMEKKLRAQPPDLVIVANSTHYPAPRDVWRDGLRELLSALPTSRVLLLDDTPFFPHRVPSCLSNNRTDIGICEVARSKAYRPKYKTVALEVAKQTGVMFASMNPWVCPYALCPVIVNHFLLWRDTNHITVTYSRQLAPAFGRLVANALQRRT